MRLNHQFHIALNSPEAHASADPNGRSVLSIGASMYNKFGGRYVFTTAPVLNWGALITAIISFIIIAIVLFIIVKVVSTAQKKKAELEAKAKEIYYEKHPEERPVPPEPGKPEPTELDYLKRIADALDKKEAK